jgi:bacillithiol system protein YtxJ
MARRKLHTIPERNDMTPITDESTLDRILKADKAVVYKHSNICSVSRVAIQQIQQFADDHPDVPVYVIDVRAHRPLSRQVAERFDIRHESPQVIVVKGGRAVWNASHYEITAEAVAEKVRET